MISERMFDLGSRRSAIRELFEYGKQAALTVGEENVFDFSLGNPSTPPPEEFTETAMEILRNEPPCAVHGYTSAQGDFATRKSVASDLASRYGAKISPEKIYMTCGAAASLCIAFHALVSSKDDNIVAVAPYFPEYRVFVEGTGARFRATKPDTVSFGIDFASLSEQIDEHTRAVIVNFPNNPSGALLSSEALTSLAALLKEKAATFGAPIYLISDEPYREITYETPAPYLPDFYPDTIICYSYSKSLSLPGERIGYVALPDGVSDIDRLYAAICGAGRSLGYVCAPALMQKILAKNASMTSDFSSYRENRDLLYSALTALGYSCVLPQGAFYLFVKAPNGDAVAFSEKAKELNILLVPGDGFGCPGYVRIAYCVDRGRIERSLPAFAKLIRILR